MTPHVHLAHLDRGDRESVRGLAGAFARQNPGYGLDWQPELATLTAGDDAHVVFVQEGQAEASVGDAKGVSDARSVIDVGDVVVLRPGEQLACEPSVSALGFRVPPQVPDRLPSFLRPDHDPKITDTPGGCATAQGAYRRVLLTWLGGNGPYVWHALNAHRVRMTNSFSHYHPVDGGFDELYLVQMTSPGAGVFTSEVVERIVAPEGVSREDLRGLVAFTELAVGDLVWFPRGVMHRAVGGVLAHVITVPGFVPGSEIGVDHHLRTINERLGLSGEAALPLNREASAGPVVK